MFRTFVFVSIISAACAIDLRNVFENWSSHFSIQFKNEIHRQSVFGKWLDNHHHIERVNYQNLTYTLGHNQFSGMDSADFSNYLALSSNDILNQFSSGFSFEIRDDASRRSLTFGLTALPASVDWVSKGGVTPVKDQGKCGSCWSFSTTGALEGAYFNKNGKLVSFSEQQLVDCDNLSNGGRDHGCSGGLMDNAFNWIAKNNGLCTESAYPYVSGTTKTAGDCKSSCQNVAGSTIVKHVDVATKSDSALMTAIAQQPVSIAIEADQQDFQLYKSGVFTGTCGTNLDHGVLVVGYGSDAGLDYYKVKNSWSSSWGEGGYIRFGRGTQYNAGSGQCGILLQASYPVL
jgi:C1A family cysteine protease